MEINWKRPREFIGRWLKLKVNEEKDWHMGLGARELDSGLSPAMKLLCDSVQVILFLYSAVSMSLK